MWMGEGERVGMIVGAARRKVAAAEVLVGEGQCKERVPARGHRGVVLVAATSGAATPSAPTMSVRLAEAAGQPTAAAEASAYAATTIIPHVSIYN